MTAHFKNPIICAIDTAIFEEALQLAHILKDTVGGIKLGLEFFIQHGPQGVRQISDLGIPIFLDLKLYDIPHQISGAVRAALSMDIAMLTLHTSGGKAMMQRAYEAKKQSNSNALLLGVTILTSMDATTLKEAGHTHSLDQLVEQLASVAHTSKFDGVVCSALEISLLKKRFGDNLKLVVPGIRPKFSAEDDQKRTMSPREAFERGADYLVIGRPITQHASPKEAAQEILSSLT